MTPTRFAYLFLALLAGCSSNSPSAPTPSPTPTAPRLVGPIQYDYYSDEAQSRAIIGTWRMPIENGKINILTFSQDGTGTQQYSAERLVDKAAIRAVGVIDYRWWIKRFQLHMEVTSVAGPLAPLADWVVIGGHDRHTIASFRKERLELGPNLTDAGKPSGKGGLLGYGDTKEFVLVKD